MGLLWPITSTIVFVLALYVNFTSEMGSASARYLIPLTPPGYFFSIWGLIYLMMIPFLISTYTNSSTQRMSFHVAFISSSVFNAAWLILFPQDRPILQYPMLLGLAASLFVVREHQQRFKDSISYFGVDKMAIWAIDLYLGWLLVANTLGIAIMLKYGIFMWVDDRKYRFVYIILLSLLVSVGGMLAIRYRDLVIALPVLWGCLGVVLKQIN
eukprot:gnl/Dysnectes_brevis/3333_a4186_760.p1 GENE.gnl/Dysnectes_brevis/3333_a4186_760~~gnl/Dysnectes_brevis/3333_a4186_760.p1  ORF type:complete len:212 (+),score=21.92 gnl/Dysnectes_brevis/3333_a4186_760:152-787(+)